MRAVYMLALLLTMCSKPGFKYNVEIISIIQPKPDERPNYCTYNIKSTDDTIVLPRSYFLDTCGSHQVGEVLSMEINDMK